MDNHRIQMTPELGGRLKTFRNQYNIKAKDVATMLDKSAAYVSKLEKGEIQQIEKKEFVRIVDFITGGNEGYEKFFKYVSDLADEEELEKSIFILNFDWVERLLPIPSELVSYINNKIEKNQIELVQLIKYINKNDEIESTFFEEYGIDESTIEPNVWKSIPELDSNKVRRNYIWVEVEQEQIERILNETDTQSNYLTMYVLLYHIYKLEELQKHLILDEKKRKQLKKKTEEKLQSCKVYTFADKNSRILQADGNSQLAEVLNEFDYDNRILIEELIGYVSMLSEFDVKYTNKKLRGIINNFEKTDPSFSVAYMAIPLEKLNELHNSVKREFLKGVNELVQKYSEMAESDPGYERY